jgi:D-alanyl-D-alanine endopeptidase (penicillin-binding protein 7)
MVFFKKNKTLSISIIFLAVSIGFFLFLTLNMPAKEISIKKEIQTGSLVEALETKNQEKNKLKFRQINNFYAEKKEEFISQKTDFLEINLEKMKARVYKNGLLEKEVDVLAKGDPDFWGGVPSGLYKVISGNKKAFSNISEVYMPWSINFYGKYYLHGEPYYPNGKPSEFDYTGGCVRFSNEDAEYIYNTTEIGMPVLIIDKENNEYNYSYWKKEIPLPELSARSWLVADLDNYYVLAEKNSKEILPIASLTKLMTAVVVVENKDLRKSILVEDQMLKAYGSTKGLEAGKTYNLVELLHPLLTQSSNDAAEVLSYFLGRKESIASMNEKAEMLGMESTFFDDPSGLSEKNVSTAQDLFYLARYILNNRPPLLKITKGEIIETFGKVSFEELNNKNIFLKSQDFEGGKTGFITVSGYTGLFIFNLPLPDGTNHNIVFIFLKSENLKDDVQKILRCWLQENYLQ